MRNKKHAPLSAFVLGVAGGLAGTIFFVLLCEFLLPYAKWLLPANAGHSLGGWRERSLLAAPGVISICVWSLLLEGEKSEVSRKGSRIIGTVTTERSIASIDQSITQWVCYWFAVSLATGGLMTFGSILLGSLVFSK